MIEQSGCGCFCGIKVEFFSIESTVIRWQAVRWSLESKKGRVAEEGGKRAVFTNDTLPEFQFLQKMKVFLLGFEQGVSALSLLKSVASVHYLVLKSFVV